MKEIFGFYGVKCEIKYAKKALVAGTFIPVIDSTLFYNSPLTAYIIVEIKIPPISTKWDVNEDTTLTGVSVLTPFTDNNILGSKAINGEFKLKSVATGLEYKVEIKTDPKIDVSSVEYALENESGVPINSYVI